MPSDARPLPTVELRTGSEKPARLLYVEEGTRLIVIPTGDAGWFHRAAHLGSAHVRRENEAESVWATEVVFAIEDLERIRGLYRAKYGEELWRSYFERASRALALDRHRPPRMLTPDEILRGEFDSVASGYDESISAHPIDRYLKERVAQRFSRSLAMLDPLLEVGPGTGYHTLRLLAAGHRVMAVDVSDVMLRELRRRAAEAGVAERLETRTGRLRDIAPLLADLPDGAFRGACSAFGAFNLESELREASAALARLVLPGGRLIFTALNRPGLAPMVWEFAAGRPRAALRRTGAVIPAGGVRYPLELYVPSLAGWDRLLRNGFRRQGVAAVSVVAPPFDSDRLLAILGTAGRRRAQALDRRLATRPGSWVAAEWLILSYERMPEAPGPKAPT